MTTYYDPNALKAWIVQALKSSYTKNQVRKESWESLCDLTHFDHFQDSYAMPSRFYLSINLFLNTEGRGDDVTNDSKMNFVTTLLYICKVLSPPVSPAQVRAAAPSRLRPPAQSAQTSSSATSSAPRATSSSLSGAPTSGAPAFSGGPSSAQPTSGSSAQQYTSTSSPNTGGVI